MPERDARKRTRRAFAMGSLRHEGVALNANGAGIAADPTLTDTWSCPKAGTWHPMFSLPVCPKTFLPVLSPALAPASGSTLQSIRSDCAATEAARFALPNLPSTGGSAAWITVDGRSFKRWHPMSGPKTFHLAPPRHPTGYSRPVEEQQRVSVIDPPCIWPKPST